MYNFNDMFYQYITDIDNGVLEAEHTMEGFNAYHENIIEVARTAKAAVPAESVYVTEYYNQMITEEAARAAAAAVPE